MKWMKVNMKPFMALFMAMNAALVLWSSSAVASLESPQQEVERITTDLLATFEKNIGNYKKQGDVGVDLFIAEVDRQLSPVVAFNSIAKGVMGKYSRRVSAEQLDQFTRVFKSSLINFYGKALLKLDDTQLTIESVKAVPESVLKDYEAGKARLIPVDMSVRTSTTSVALSYSMVYMDDRWKLRNIIVDGINIGIQFRNQFADAMNKHGDVQYVIDNWTKIMEGNAASEKKS
ncbi:MlaC/ttg2D family ABC transporter substrate-binding protein [Endozoicomonas ascidiicola]|uniref:MlaC/ttg2D family ABC transporter substrate-binding protein n=1 Tax=Endozoicomonas ascidiicola TaxID=1698521 RepID=UPI000A3EF993|nr:ABC transporter substrate-binding protein [Endozoicomonas ascidiicola]